MSARAQLHVPAALPEEELLRETVRGLAGAFGHDYFVARARAGQAPTELWAALGHAGLLGVAIGEEHGGGGGGLSHLAIVCEELAAAGCPLLLLVVSAAIGATVLQRHGTAEQQAGWLPALAAGARAVGFAITEAEAGSNSHRITTTARPSGGGWRLHGVKQFISCADQVDGLLVVARVDQGRADAPLGLFLVPLPCAGVHLEAIPMELVTPERQFEVLFHRAQLPADALVGGAPRGLKQVFTGLNPERIATAATAVGLGRYALERATRYAREREVWGAPIGTHQAIAHPLADAYVQLRLAGLMTREAAALWDAGAEAGEAANVAKYAAAEAALATLDRAIQVHGGNGLSREHGLADLLGLARLFRIAPVSREMILNFLAQHALGLPRSYARPAPALEPR